MIKWRNLHYPLIKQYQHNWCSRGISQLIVMMEWLRAPCLHDGFVRARKLPALWCRLGRFCHGSWQGKEALGEECKEGVHGHGHRLQGAGAALWLLPWHWSVPCQAPEAVQTCWETANAVTWNSHLPWALQTERCSVHKSPQWTIKGLHWLCLILLSALHDRLIPHKMPSTSLMTHTWLEGPSQKINSCTGAAEPWTAPTNPRTFCCSVTQANSFPREDRSLQGEVFAIVLPSGELSLGSVPCKQLLSRVHTCVDSARTCFHCLWHTLLSSQV